MSALRATMALDAIGAETTETNIKQMEVMLEAFDVFIERQGDYSDLWKASGSENNRLQAESKVARMGVTAARVETRVDSGIDLINYAAFYVRNVREGR